MIGILLISASVVFMLASFVVIWRGRGDLFDYEAEATTRRFGWCVLGAWVCCLTALVIQ